MQHLFHHSNPFSDALRNSQQFEPMIDEGGVTDDGQLNCLHESWVKHVKENQDLYERGIPV